MRMTLALTVFVLPVALFGQATATEQTEFFETRIRPVLAAQCFSCHTNSKMGGLRLETREGMLKGGKSGPAVIPGDPEKSLLIIAVRHAGADLKMPKGATKLTDAEIADLTKWVKDGAYWPVEGKAARADGKGYIITAAQRRFWSIQPLRNPPPPALKDASWPANDIDRFVLARLEKDNLKPAPIADRRTLLRRVTYDLTGLPPSYEEVKTFEADRSPNAYEKVVDRLLASPHYGEMWARHWLDVVRYGEDDYRISQKPERVERYPHAYAYRDWVIKSLNDDMPYDTFVKAQLAGDLVDEKIRPRMIPGLGMNGLGVWQWNANVAAIERADEWHDKVDVTTKAFLGLTVGCARCHDHKYDPIPTKDYYRLAGIFASSSYEPYPLVPKSVVDEYENRKKELEEKEKRLTDFLEKVSSLYAQTLFEQTEDYMVAAWRVGSEKRATPATVAEEYKLDPEILTRWVRFLKKKPTNYTFFVPWQELVARGGTVEEAKKMVHEFYLKAVEIDKARAKIKEENEFELAKMKDPNEKFDPLPNGLKRKLTKYQIDLKGLDREQSYLWQDMFEKDLTEFLTTVDIVDKEDPGLLKLTGNALERRLNLDWASHVARLKSDIEAFKKAMPPQYPFVYGIKDEKEPVDLKVFLRGNPFNFGEDAPRAFLSLFADGEPQPFTKGSGRLELAEAIIKQPVAVRVIVNRLWRWHMGTGLVDTPNNFGLVGERPSNPDLLERLASKFVAGGMSFKQLHKDIVMSRVYQLSSASVDANVAKDPENRLYWRSNRRRLEAEGVWDSLLAASGKLDLTKIGGPSQDLAAGMTRRGVYGNVSRMYPNEFQLTFDFPTPTISSERRYTTNVPQQRLFFLNSEFVRLQAEALAQRVKGAGNDEAQVQKAFEIVYQRLPTPSELAALLQPMRSPTKPTASEGAPAGAAASLAAKPAGSVTTSTAPAETKDSALQSVCWVLLSSNEFLFLN
jgi:mono/diheme cytochrome c family protein